MLSVINILMQLRKVCNHPNLFEVRPIISPFQMIGILFYTASIVTKIFEYDWTKVIFKKDICGVVLGKNGFLNIYFKKCFSL